MKERKRLWKAGYIGPKMVLLGAATIVFCMFGAAVTSLLLAKPDGTLSSAGDNFWHHLYAAGAILFMAGLLVTLFQGILWLVCRAGAALRKNERPAQ